MTVSKTFVQEFVVGFGFLSGVWINIGINPETEILRAFADVINTLQPDNQIGFIFWLLPIIFIIGSLVATYVIARVPGLIAVGLAFLGGLFFHTTFGGIMLVIAIVLGLIAPMVGE